MRWIHAALVLCLFGDISDSRQSSSSVDNIATPPSLDWNNVNSHSSSPPPLKLDPILRRALLRALTQLEVEAERNAAGVTVAPPDEASFDSQPADKEQEANIKRDLEELLGNYENSYNQGFEDTKVRDELSKEPQINQEDLQKEHSDSTKESVDMIIVDGPNQEEADVSVFDYEAPLVGKTNKEPESQKPDESSSFVDKPEAAAIFYRNENESEVKFEDTRQTQINTQPKDIQTNIIPLNPRYLNAKSSKREDELDSSPSGLSSSPDKISDEKNLPPDNKSSATSSAESVKLDVVDQDVSIFQAPLVAAFTLEQDEKGNPKSVVPLLRRPQPVINQQQQRLQQTALQQQQQQGFQQQSSLGFSQQQIQLPPFQVPAQQHRFQPLQSQLTREQELERKTRLLEQQVFQLQQQQQLQQQVQQLQVLKEQQQLLQQELQRLRQQKLNEEQQQRLRFQQQQQQQQQNNQFLQAEQPSPAQVQIQHQRPLRQETGTAIVDFQQSSSFQFQPPNNFQQKPTNNLQQQSSNNFQQQPSNSFQQPPNSFQQQPSNNFQQQPSNSFQQPPNSLQQQPPNNFQQQPSNNFQQQPSNSFQQPPNSFQQQPSNSFQQPPNSFQQQPSNSFQQQPPNSFQQPSNSFQQQPSNSFQQQSGNSFQKQSSNGFEVQPSVSTNFFQPQPQANNFFQQQQLPFTSILPQHSRFQNSNPANVNNQLQNLLYQSGVAGDFADFASPQEDLNIVSKVLSLNHEGRIRPGRETLELTVGVKPPSRVIAPPFP